MFPLRDNIPSRTIPFVNLSLIFANFVVFIYELSLGPHLESFLTTYGLLPIRYAALPWHRGVFYVLTSLSPHTYLLPLMASMFLHGGWMHIISNMWSLYIFGDNVEDRMGHLRYLIFYLTAGLSAGFIHLIFNWGSSLPTVGASGAVAGVMGAYLFLYPLARVVVLVPIFIFLQTVEIPAFLFLGIWLFFQFYAGTAVLAGAQRMGGIAWWAHVGGFLGGILLMWPFLKKRR